MYHISVKIAHGFTFEPLPSLYLLSTLCVDSYYDLHMSSENRCAPDWDDLSDARSEVLGVIERPALFHRVSPVWFSNDHSYKFYIRGPLSNTSCERWRHQKTEFRNASAHVQAQVKGTHPCYTICMSYCTLKLNINIIAIHIYNE